MVFYRENKTNMITLDFLIARLRRGYAPIHLVVGEQRSGKTWFAIWLAEQIQPDFDVMTGLVTSIEDFAKIFSKANQQVIILDEAGVSLDPMRSAEITQRCYSHIIQSQAVRQNLIILCLPCASDFGHTHKTHISSESEVRGHNKQGTTVRNYTLNKWRADPNDVNISLFHVETIAGIPSPSKENVEKYMKLKQMVDKDSILNTELMRLEMAREKEEYRRQIYENRMTKKNQKPVEKKKPKQV